MKNRNQNSASEIESLRASAVILVIDRTTGDQQVVFGREALESIIRSGVAKRLPVARMTIDFGTEQLEKFLAMVLTAKGSYEWNGEIHKHN